MNVLVGCPDAAPVRVCARARVCMCARMPACGTGAARRRRRSGKFPSRCQCRAGFKLAPADGEPPSQSQSSASLLCHFLPPSLPPSLPCGPADMSRPAHGPADGTGRSRRGPRRLRPRIDFRLWEPPPSHTQKFNTQKFSFFNIFLYFFTNIIYIYMLP